MAAANQHGDFLILGPVSGSGEKVLNAIHALYFLPDRFKLILTGSQKANQSFYKQVVSLIERDGLAERVRFGGGTRDIDAAILPAAKSDSANHAVNGDSPEALASAILNIDRAA